jgi:hypothetical protein
LRQPNTHWIRKFNERSKLAAASGKQLVENEEIRNVISELVDLFCYINELENHIADQEKKLAESELIVVELKGDDF